MPEPIGKFVQIVPSIANKIREDLGLTIKNVSDRLGKEYKMVRRWFRGESLPTVPNAAKLAGILKCTLQQLTGEEPYPAEQKAVKADPTPKQNKSERIVVCIHTDRSADDFFSCLTNAKLFHDDFALALPQPTEKGVVALVMSKADWYLLNNFKATAMPLHDAILHIAPLTEDLRAYAEAQKAIKGILPPAENQEAYRKMFEDFTTSPV